MTAATFPHASTHTTPIPAAFMRPVLPAARTTDEFYREAAGILRTLVMGMNQAAPPNVANDPTWRTVVALAESAPVDDASRASMLLALTCVFDSGLVIEAIDDSIRERAA